MDNDTNTPQDGEEIAGYMREYTQRTKSVGRTLVFAIIATIWSMSYQNINGRISFTPDFCCQIALLLSILYLFIDFCTYVYLGCIYRRILNNYFKTIPNASRTYVDENATQKVNKCTANVQTISYWLYISMIFIMCGSAGFLIFDIAKMIYL